MPVASSQGIHDVKLEVMMAAGFCVSKLLEMCCNSDFGLSEDESSCDLSADEFSCDKGEEVPRAKSYNS